MPSAAHPPAVASLVSAHGAAPHGGTPADVAGAVLAVAAVAAVAAALSLAARLRRRGDAWPRGRDAAFTAGGLALAAACVLPLPGGPFTAHMIQHLVVGMAAPLLLVTARPLTLVLRSLPPGRARRTVLAVAHSRPVAVAALPPVAAVLDIGGLWLIHRTPLLAAAHGHPWVRALVLTHVVAAGLLFSFAVCQLDPVRRRRGLVCRGATLLAAGALHSVLAKTLYAAPPPTTGFTAADAHAAARLMYYGGDVVEAGLAAVLAAQWYAAGGRARERERRRAAGGRAVTAA